MRRASTHRTVIGWPTPTIALLVALVGSLMGCQGGLTVVSDKPPARDTAWADLIFVGGTILTVDEARPQAEALAVVAGRIVAIGGRDEILRLRDAETEIVDLQGHTLMPGFVEPHTHPAASAVLYGWTDVSGFTHKSGDEVLARLREAAAAAGPGDWILGFGFDPILTPDLRSLDADTLDGISRTNPVFIMLQAMHTYFVNHKAFEVAGITRDTPQPGAGGAFVRDEAGELTGMVIEGAGAMPFLRRMPARSREQNQALLHTQLRRYAREGITTIGAAGVLSAFIPDGAEILRDLVERPESPLRAAVYAVGNTAAAAAPTETATESDRFRSLGAKFWIDGSPYTGTMLLDDPYVDSDLMQQGLGIAPGGRGHPILERASLEAAIERHHEAGEQVAVHAQGDRAFRETVDAYEAVLSRRPRLDHRHRLEHLALAREEDLERAAGIGLTPSFHINHIYYYGEALRDDIIGPERASRLMPLAAARRHGHRQSLHADSPMYPAQPLTLMRTAVTRRTRGGAVIGADQAIPIDDAIRAVTIDAAWQLFMEDQIGSLEVGKYADLVILSENPRAIDPLGLDRIRVLETYLEGRATGGDAP